MTRPPSRPRQRRGSSVTAVLWLLLIAAAVGGAGVALYATNPDLFTSDRGDDHVAVRPTPTPTVVPTVGPTATPVPPTPTPLPPFVGGAPLDPAAVERWVITYTNEERQERGLGLLEHDPEISDIARAHSEAMVATGKLSHEVNGHGPTDRALLAGFDCQARNSDGSISYGLAENISLNHRVKQWQGIGADWKPLSYMRTVQDTARDIVGNWMDSPAHRENILDESYRRIGVGVVTEVKEKYGWHNETFYATQNFSSCR